MSDKDNLKGQILQIFEEEENVEVYMEDDDGKIRFVGTNRDSGLEDEDQKGEKKRRRRKDRNRQKENTNTERRHNDESGSDDDNESGKRRRSERKKGSQARLDNNER